MGFIGALWRIPRILKKGFMGAWKVLGDPKKGGKFQRCIGFQVDQYGLNLGIPRDSKHGVIGALVIPWD